MLHRINHGLGYHAERAYDGVVRAVDVRGDVEAAEFMDLRRRLWNRAAAAHREDAPLHFDDIVVPSHDRLVAESLWIVHALWHCRVHPFRHFKRLFDSVEEREGVDFLGGLYLQSEKALDPRTARALRYRRRIARRLVVGECDAVHSRGNGARHDFGRRHLEICAGRKAAVDVQVKFHDTCIIAKWRTLRVPKTRDIEIFGRRFGHMSGGKFDIISAITAGVVQWLTTPDL